MVEISLDIPKFTIKRGDKKKAIIKYWLSGKTVERIQQLTGASYIHINGVINEINNRH